MLQKSCTNIFTKLADSASLKEEAIDLQSPYPFKSVYTTALSDVTVSFNEKLPVVRQAIGIADLTIAGMSGLFSVNKTRVARSKAFFNPGLNCSEQLIIFQIGAGLVIGKVTALFRPGFVDGTPLAHPVVCKKDA